MNWNGGARARAQENQNQGFIPNRKQQQQRRGSRDVSNNESNDRNAPPPIRLPYSGYDVSSDPRYERVVTKSDNVLYRTVPLLETAKNVFPNGELLSLQLSFQMEIHKSVVRNPPQDDENSSEKSYVIRRLPAARTTTSEMDIEEEERSVRSQAEVDTDMSQIGSESGASENERLGLIRSNFARSLLSVMGNDSRHHIAQKSTEFQYGTSSKSIARVDGHNSEEGSGKRARTEGSVQQSRRASINYQTSEESNTSTRYRDDNEDLLVPDSDYEETSIYFAPGPTTVTEPEKEKANSRCVHLGPGSHISPYHFLPEVFKSVSVVRGATLTEESENESQKSLFSQASPAKSLLGIVEAVYSSPDSSSQFTDNSISKYFATDDEDHSPVQRSSTAIPLPTSKNTPKKPTTS